MLVAALCIPFAAPCTAEEAPAAPPTDTASPPPPAGAKKPEPAAKVSENIVVSATRGEREATEVPVSASVILEKQIASTPAHTVDDLLRNVPGLNLPSTNSTVVYPTSNTVSMRGLGGNRTLVLLDGTPLNDPFSGYIPWNRVALSTIERIEVVRGGAASLFGNYAMGGIVNIFTRPAGESRVSAGASYGSNDTRQLSASVDQRLSASTGIGIDVGTFDTDGYFRTAAEQRGAIDTPFASRNRVFGLRLDHTSSSGLTTFARGTYFRNHLSQGTALSYDERQSYDFAGGIRKAAAFGGEFSASAFGERQRFFVQNTSLPPDGDRDSEFLSNRHTTPIRSFGGSLQWTRSFSTIFPVFTAGVDVQRIQGEDRGEFFTTAGNRNRTRNSGGRQDFGGLYAEADLFPAARFEILVSVRLDSWRNFDGHEIVDPGNDARYSSHHTTRIDPRLSLRYDLGSGWAIRAAGYRAFRAPTLNDLYRTTQSKTFIQTGNPKLGAETLVGGEAGLDASGRGWSVQLNVFVNTVDNLISTVPVSTKPSLVLKAANIGETRSRGVELFGRASLGGPWSAQASLTLTRATIIDNPTDRSLEGNDVPLVPRRFGSLGVSYESPWGLTATFRGRALSRRYQDSANAIPLDAHALFDLFLAYTLIGGVEMTASAENLLDRRYVSDALVGPRFGAPRQYFVGLRLQHR
jgi:outer membrane receptor protein involved in Fe transport